MEASRTPVVITLSLFLALLFGINVTALVIYDDPQPAGPEPEPELEPFPPIKFELKGMTNKAFKLANATDPDIMNAAKFACDEYNKKARASGGTLWMCEYVIKAKTLDLGNGGKKIIAIIIGAFHGPMRNNCQAMVKVKNNGVQNLIEFQTPK